VALRWVVRYTLDGELLSALAWVLLVAVWVINLKVLDQFKVVQRNQDRLILVIAWFHQVRLRQHQYLRCLVNQGDQVMLFASIC
jgi:hypothetical protein